jgi:hypothetical protein
MRNHGGMLRRRFFIFVRLLVCLFSAAIDSLLADSRPEALPPLNEVVNSGVDAWGEAAMKQTNGASYEFFAGLLPPPRYVNADFHFYPIVLSAPNAKVKARLISNGSGVNLRGGTRSWYDNGTPFMFRVGPDELRFGEIKNRLQHPTLADGYLPVYQIDYEHPTPKQDSAKTAALKMIAPPEVYRLEAFGSTAPSLAAHGVAFIKFSLTSGDKGFTSVQPDAQGIKFSEGKLTNDKGEILAWFDKNWTWSRQMAHAHLGSNTVATLAIATKPVPPDGPIPALFSAEQNNYKEQRKLCVETWLQLLQHGINIKTPEPLVNNAWRNLIIQDFAITVGSNLNYSHGNQYQKMYAAETSDAAVPLMGFGFEDDMRRFLPVMLDLADKRLTNHFASHKLDTVCRFYWQTRDAEFVKAMRPRWQKELNWIINHRGEHGLLPKDNYCTDIEQPVFSLSSNAKCWAALRDIVPVLEDIGDPNSAQSVAVVAKQYKHDILAAAEKSIRRETDPPFVPCALFGAEEIHDPITETRIGSYWDPVANYTIASGIFNRTEMENWIPRYFETHGGLCMGLTRSAATNHTFWISKHRTNPLYGMRYIIDTLRRDDPERALVSFYGMLAHGMTRNTFIGAEGTLLEPLDAGGRQFYCPPNTASNGQWLWTLRHLLVQDFDTDDDGRPETLRLAFGTPRRWLENGNQITLERAPTAFGPVSFTISSHLNEGQVVTELVLPARHPWKKAQLRVRLPDPWKVNAATVASSANNALAVDGSGTFDISSLSGKQRIIFSVERD